MLRVTWGESGVACTERLEGEGRGEVRGRGDAERLRHSSAAQAERSARNGGRAFRRAGHYAKAS